MLRGAGWTHYPLFRDFPEGLVGDLIGACSREVFGRGEEIIKAKDTAPRLLFVLFGKPEVTLFLPKKNEHSTIHVLRRNDFYGLSTFFEKRDQPQVALRARLGSPVLQPPLPPVPTPKRSCRPRTTAHANLSRTRTHLQATRAQASSPLLLPSKQPQLSAEAANLTLLGLITAQVRG